MAATLLVELFCEELPPKSLRRLGEAFGLGIATGLGKRALISGAEHRAFATPRRLAVSIPGVRSASEPQRIELKLMPASVAFDAAGEATLALAKKLQASGLAGVDIAALHRRGEGKAEMVFADAWTPSIPLAQALQAALDETLAALPIPKVMSYQLADGTTTVQFVRPAHGLVALHGREVVTVETLGLRSGRLAHGHRFQGAADIALDSADEYEARLRSEGNVIVDFDARKAEIRTQLERQARVQGASLGPEEGIGPLLEEVTALVEMPTVYAGAFEAQFLAVPAECLALTMRQNQKYFPLYDANGKLTPRFLIVSNMRLDHPANVVQGNERVIRPRLADARFFFDTDRKTRLAERVPQLASIVYHNKLGTLLERVERLRKLATRIQSMLPRGEKGRPYADRAALLAKADLVTLMVGEFPELQGTMGKYYAEADGEEPSVVRAIEQHYWPRYSGDRLPVGDVSVAVALADKLEALTGLFGVGQQPTGDKDPFALRRHALGVVRILVEGKLALPLAALLDEAYAAFGAAKVADPRAALTAFIHERLRGYLREQGFSANEVESVLSMAPTRLDLIPRQLAAVRSFAGLPEAESLAAANKRVANILKQAEAKGERFEASASEAMVEPAERALFEALAVVSREATALYDRGDYTGYLRTFAVLRAPVDAFFDSVMVMAEEEHLRRNRLGLLAELRREMNRIADLSKLAT